LDAAIESGRRLSGSLFNALGRILEFRFLGVRKRYGFDVFSARMRYLRSLVLELTTSF
jgi:hypothetical protein